MNEITGGPGNGDPTGRNTGIPKDHPRYRSLIVRERLARLAREGIVSLEGLTAHGRGEAFDYLIGERTSASAMLAEKTAAALLLTASHPVISVNGNTAALAPEEIASLQQASHAIVEINLFHRTAERVGKIRRHLESAGVNVLEGTPERILPLTHDRGLSYREGTGIADLILVPLEDGDRCEALIAMGKKVIAIDLNPLSRTSRMATLTVVDELTRALPNITSFCRTLQAEEAREVVRSIDNSYFVRDAMLEITRRLPACSG
jgi:4-phosphopantoate---beta-alanine ligase